MKINFINLISMLLCNLCLTLFLLVNGVEQGGVMLGSFILGIIWQPLTGLPVIEPKEEK